MSTNGDRLYISTNTGNTYTFTRSAGTWTQESKQAVVFAHGTLTNDDTFVSAGSVIYKKVSGVWTNYATASGSGTIFGLASEGSRALSISAANLIVNAQTTAGTSFNSGTKTLTLTGTRSQINSDLDTIVMIRPSGLTATFTLDYTVTTPRSTTASRSQTFTYSS
jgi:hypothetical protein